MYIRSATVETRVDGEKAVAAMKDEIHDLGVEVEIARPAQHVPVIERMGETIKEGFRCYEASLRYTMTLKILICCVLFVVMCISWRPNSQSNNGVSLSEKFKGRKT
jgi:hypothetical protein